MQMIDGIHPRLTNRVKMHQVAVIREKVVVGAGSAILIRMKRLHLKGEDIASEGRRNLQRPIHIRRIARGLGIPPYPTQPDKNPHENQAACSPQNRSPSPVRGGSQAGLEARFTNGCRDNSSHTYNEKKAEYPKRNPKPALHLQRRKRNCGHRNRSNLLSSTARNLEAHLPG